MGVCPVGDSNNNDKPKGHWKAKFEAEVEEYMNSHPSVSHADAAVRAQHPRKSKSRGSSNNLFIQQKQQQS